MGRMFAAIAAMIVSLLLAVPAGAQPEPAPPGPTPDPNAPKCLTMSGQPFPHLQYLPCGWDWDGTRWISKP